MKTLPIKLQEITSIQIIGLMLIISCGILIGVTLEKIVPILPSQFNVECPVGENITISPQDVGQIKHQLLDIGLSNASFMNSTGIQNHVERLCRGEVTGAVLDTYISQLESLTDIGHQFGQPVPVALWDVQTPEMQVENVSEYEAINTLVNSELEYAQLLIRAYNRFYIFKQNQSRDTALDTALDIFLYTVEYYEQVTNLDFGTIDAEAKEEIGIAIIQTWQQIIGSTARTNPLNGDPLFPFNMFSHFNVTDMWRQHTRQNIFIGLIWGVSGFDLHFVGDLQNSNQVEHLAMSMALQYVYNYSVVLLNTLEVRDTLNGKQQPVMSLADQNINNIIASEFLPLFKDNYVYAIEYLRCILAVAETASCTESAC